MDILALVGALGRALVSRGLLGGQDIEPAEEVVVACPTVRLRAARHTSVESEAAAHTSVRLSAAEHTTVELTTDC